MIMADKIRWGLMGAGAIVERWIKGARQLPNMEIVAVASRSQETALKAAKKYGIPDAMTYKELAEREDIDVVYIPVPHMAHKHLAILAMNHGKSVLVEKPAAVNAKEWQEMIDCAKANNVFLMEAVWTRFFPLVKTIRGLLNEDGIGEVRAVNTAFSFRVPGDMLESRLLSPELAGGGLLDTGVYNLQFCDMIYDKSPVALTGFAAIDSDKNHIQVDEQAMYLAKYDKGELASMASGVRTNMIDTAYIYGTKGHIEVPVFWKPTIMSVTINGKRSEYREAVPSKHPDYVDEGFQYEISHVNECLRKGIKESPVMTLKKSLSIMMQCDELRKQWGLKYPFEINN
jgi:predicted dehydrogenase